MQARCLAVSMMVGATGAVGAWVVVIRVFFRQSFVTFGPYTTISPTVRILLPSSTSASVPAGGDPSGVSGRRRVRRDDAAGDAQRGGLGLRVRHSPEHRGDVGRRDLSSGYLGGV